MAATFSSVAAFFVSSAAAIRASISPRSIPASSAIFKAVLASGTLGEHLEQMRLNENINLNKVAEKMRALESSFTGLVKQYTDKGELPPKIQHDHKIYSPDDIAKVIEAFNEMAYGGSDTE
ncbi:hypothetical protein [uncultured Herbaspirillum sp.]|uniref:hypothetical protein n=1 Tax=uncultured Herbaspirillum sp. TaxID=160236 RepID=UPI00258B5F42|nr:hypothetical protein [uncultured Herbaspirillum sp.]